MSNVTEMKKLDRINNSSRGLWEKMKLWNDGALKV